MEQILHELKHFLPAQAPLKDFVHHNTLHAFQHLSFFQGLKQANDQFGYKGFLSLSDYRNLYREGKIKGLVLKKILENQFGDQANAWLVKLLDESQDRLKSPKIGQFRQTNSTKQDMRSPFLKKMPKSGGFYATEFLISNWKNGSLIGELL